MNIVITDLTDRILRQGRALVRAIEALGTIEPSGQYEQALARLLQAVYNHQLRNAVEFVSASPVWPPNVEVREMI